MMEFVSWDDFPFPTEWKVIKHVPVTTNQQHTLSDHNNYNIHNVLMQNVPFHFRPPHAIISAGQPASPPFNWLQPMDLLLLSYLVRGMIILIISLYIYIYLFILGVPPNNAKIDNFSIETYGLWFWRSPFLSEPPILIASDNTHLSSLSSCLTHSSY